MKKTSTLFNYVYPSQNHLILAKKIGLSLKNDYSNLYPGRRTLSFLVHYAAAIEIRPTTCFGMVEMIMN